MAVKSWKAELFLISHFQWILSRVGERERARAREREGIEGIEGKEKEGERGERGE